MTARGGAPRVAVERRLRAALWSAIGRFAFRLTPHNWYAVRRSVLRAFGARIASRAKLRRSVRVDRPWNLEVGDRTVVGDETALRARSPITIGARSVVSQFSILTTEIRDAGAPGRPARTAPITIGDDCWIAADSLVLPGVTVNQGTVVGARGMVDGTLPEWTVATGEPAVPRAKRELRPAAAGSSRSTSATSAET